jgi:polysaccharide biosynthesis protein PslA
MNSTVRVVGKEPRTLFFAADEPAGEAFEPQESFRARSAEMVRARLLISLFALDILCIGLGISIVGAIRLGSPIEEQSIHTLAVVLPMFVAVALNNGSYSLEALERPSLGIKRAVQALIYACAVAIALLFYLKMSEQFSRVIFGAGTVVALGGLICVRTLFGNAVGAKRRWTFCNRLVISDGVPVSPHPGDCIVFADKLGITPGNDEPLSRHKLGEMLLSFDSVVLACPPERRRKWSHTLKGAAVDVEILMPELAHLGAVQLRHVHGERTLVVSSRPLRLRDRFFKRVIDLLVAGAALVMLAPVMLLLALAIKIESSGPVFFRQQRVGQNNRMFNLLKFRSMRTECSDAEGIRSASPSDERVTALGQFMRQTSLDELPQLFNVITGEMSIVGPRPHALGSTAEDVLFWHIDQRYFERHALKPGITGLAQVRGYRGATARHHDLTDRLQADLEYLSGWTIWRDLKIICRTFRVLIHPKAF